MRTQKENNRDDAIVLAALPGTMLDFQKKTILPNWVVKLTLRRLKRAGKVRYVREMKRWERVIEL